jgi:hypothetical protein
VSTWTYEHRDLDEPHLPDGSPILRPCVEVSVRTDAVYLGVIDSGSPITVADPAFVTEAGIDLERDRPVMEIPVGLGAAFGHVPLYEIELDLLPPIGLDEPPRRWRLLVGARPRWRLPFTILFGQRGWFDCFPTTIGASDITVHLGR